MLNVDVFFLVNIIKKYIYYRSFVINFLQEFKNSFKS